MKLGNNIQFLRNNRYLLFAQRINLNATDTMNGLQDIFLNDIDKENECYQH